MTSAQKVIKYLAIAFAIFLIITIISGILSALYGLSWILGLKKDNEAVQSGDIITTNFDNNDIKKLDIDVAYSNLTIKNGESFKIETNSKNIISKQNNEKLQIEEKSYKWFSNHNDEILTIYIPEDLEFEKVEIDTGAGKIYIENVTTEKFEFDLGAGETQIDTLNVFKDCNINGGAGKLTISNGEINDLDFDMGVGETNLTATLIGKNEIDAGIGKLNINLQENKELYKISVDKGLGSIKIDGKEITDNKVYGDGENYIDIDGGIGSIDINF